MFYIRNTDVYNGSGTYVDFYSSASGYLGDEASIVPIPGTCRDFFIVFTKHTGMGMVKIYYSKVSVTLAGVVTVSNKDYMIDNIGGGPAGIAVSTAQSDNSRILYCKAAYSLKKYTISSLGISFNATLSTSTDLGDFTTELELSPNQEYLSWGNLNDNSVSIYSLLTTTLSKFNTSNTGFVPIIYGIEFSPDNSKLYISLNSYIGSTRTGGIYKMDRVTGTNTQLTTNDLYGKSQLELGRDGYIYAVDNGALGRINVSTDAVSSAGISGTIYSNQTQAGQTLYRLPDQIDGDSYNYFFGTPKPTVDGTINGAAVSASTPLVACISNPISYSTTSSSVTSYRVRIYNSNISGAQLTEVGTTPSWTSGSLPSSINLKTLYSNYLTSNTGYYLVLLETLNTCAQSTKAALLNVISVPLPTSNFTFTLGTTLNVTPNTTWPGNAACQLYTTINGNSSSGYVTY